MSGNGKGDNNRRNRTGSSRQRFSGRRNDAQKHGKKTGDNLFTDGKYEKSRQNTQERLRWTAPVMPANPITTPDCPWCEKQITDITTAITDKETGQPVHFDCVIARIAQMENLEANESVCYIGGGRFGIIRYSNPQDTRTFTIKKIFEWEIKETSSEWRQPISEYFSIT